MTGRIFQFGTSRFLQAHVALFAHEAREAGQPVLPITVVQVTGSAERARRVAAFNDPAGYAVHIRGLENGAPVDRRIQVRSVRQGIAAQTQWAELARAFAADAVYVVSNVGDSGFAVPEEDLLPDALTGDKAPLSYPAILTALLFGRWRAHKAPLSILPCELIAGNGNMLRQVVTSLARRHFADDAFQRWLETDIFWINSLVDRIVSEALDPVGAVAEPYALWAIEKKPGAPMPFTHCSVVVTEDLARYERLKLFILNLGHTAIAHRWIEAGREPGTTVRAHLSREANLSWLIDLYSKEVLPVFAAAKMSDEAADYMESTIQRFQNPFLDHKISDIAHDHQAKVEKRVGAFLDWAAEMYMVPDAPRLSAIAGRQDDTVR